MGGQRESERSRGLGNTRGGASNTERDEPSQRGKSRGWPLKTQESRESNSLVVRHEDRSNMNPFSTPAAHTFIFPCRTACSVLAVLASPPEPDSVVATFRQPRISAFVQGARDGIRYCHGAGGRPGVFCELEILPIVFCFLCWPSTVRMQPGEEESVAYPLFTSDATSEKPQQLCFAGVPSVPLFSSPPSRAAPARALEAVRRDREAAVNN